jgi:poly(hydroxyalkanoate) depolymerase family esterase
VSISRKSELKFNGINETIQRALAAAGLNKSSRVMSGVTDTINRTLTAAGLTQTPEAPATERHTEERSVGGRFVQRSFANGAGSRDYKLYIPASYSPESTESAPLIVMLHGCKQSPDDFAAGTRMNSLADDHGFLVVYPAQAANANGSRCWNWFRPEDQRRDVGEPSIIAGITREVSSAFRVDSRRVFVAGMSAGASMALILGDRYPELYAAVGAHSGPPYWAAHDVPSAFAAMKDGSAKQGRMPRSRPSSPMPTIVFHGDQDHTVNVGNATGVVGHATSGPGLEQVRLIDGEGTAPGGRRYHRTEYMDLANRCVVEQWIVHGAGHAWSGGSSSGSFTDPAGPDASAEMVRFFLSQVRAGTS